MVEFVHFENESMWYLCESYQNHDLLSYTFINLLECFFSEVLGELILHWLAHVVKLNSQYHSISALSKEYAKMRPRPPIKYLSVKLFHILWLLQFILSVHISTYFASAIKPSAKSCISVSSGQFRMFRIPMISLTMGDVDPRLRFEDDFTSWVISVGKTEESAKRYARVKTSDTAAPTMVPTVATSSEVDISVEEVKVLFKESNRRWRSAIFLWENRLSNWILFWNPFQKQNAQVVNLKNPDLDLIRRIHPACGFYGFMIRLIFGFAQKNPPTNSVFSSSSEASTYFQI